jgi:hypothetical protein
MQNPGIAISCHMCRACEQPVVQRVGERLMVTEKLLVPAAMLLHFAKEDTQQNTASAEEFLKTKLVMDHHLFNALRMMAGSSPGFVISLALCNLGNVLVDRYTHADCSKQEAIEFGIRCYKLALTELKPESKEHTRAWVTCMMNLGHAYYQRAMLEQGDKADNVDSVLMCYERVWPHIDPKTDADTYVHVGLNLTSVYVDRKRGDPKENRVTAAKIKDKMLDEGKRNVGVASAFMKRTLEVLKLQSPGFGDLGL